MVRGDPAEVARELAHEGRAASFALSEELGAWRVVARDGSWQIDVERLRGETLEDDLRLRDFTVNAVAQTLDGAETFDPLEGARTSRGGGFAPSLRVPSWTMPARAAPRTPRREPRPARNPETLVLGREAAPALVAVLPERIFAELRAIIDGPAPLEGLRLMDELGATTVVLPELDALRGVQQSRFHHRDVLGHTLEVLGESVRLARDPAAFGRRARRRRRGAPGGAACGRPHTRRRAALGRALPRRRETGTRAVRPDGRVTFIAHDARGAEMASAVLRRLRASERLRAHVAALVRNHLRLGFLVHEPQPLDRRVVYAYLRACEPVEVDVTLLSVADRLATRGDRSKEAIDAHLALAGRCQDALRWRAEGAPRPLWRGDELARELGIERGPRLGELLEALREAQYAGAVSTPSQALEHARGLIASDRGRT